MSIDGAVILGEPHCAVGPVFVRTCYYPAEGKYGWSVQRQGSILVIWVEDLFNHQEAAAASARRWLSEHLPRIQNV